MAKVRSDAKTDKRIARQLETMKKWKAAKKNAHRESRKLAEKLRPLEDKLQIELDIHTKKRWSTFDAKHASLIAAHPGGWGCSSYRDVQRSPNEHDEDDM